MKSLTILIALILFQASILFAENLEIAFLVERDESEPHSERMYKLYAIENNKKYLLEPSDEYWYIEHYYKELVIIEDLDGDNVPEALLRTQGQGNCCGPTFFVIHRVEEGFYSIITGKELTGWPRASVKEKGGRKFIWVYNQSEGIDDTSLERTLSILKFENGKLHLVSKHFNTAFLSSELEVTSLELSKVSKKRMDFDLDGDDTIDGMVCKYWSRWGAVGCDIKSSQFGEFHLSGGCDRIGILSTASNGMRDIVCGRNHVFKFDPAGPSYIYD